MNKTYLFFLPVAFVCSAVSASDDWITFSKNSQSEIQVKKSELDKAKFTEPFILHFKTTELKGKSNQAGDKETIGTYYVDCQSMKYALADVVVSEYDENGVAKDPVRTIIYDSRQPPQEGGQWKSLGVDIHSPKNFCKDVSGWDANKVKVAYPNKYWRNASADNSLHYLSTDDLNYATISKPFAVRAKSFVNIDLEEGSATAITHTQMIDCKIGKSRPISKVFTSNDSIYEYNPNPKVVKTEIVNGEWREFNVKNAVFSEICEPLKDKS